MHRKRNAKGNQNTIFPLLICFSIEKEKFAKKKSVEANALFMRGHVTDIYLFLWVWVWRQIIMNHRRLCWWEMGTRETFFSCSCPTYEFWFSEIGGKEKANSLKLTFLKSSLLELHIVSLNLYSAKKRIKFTQKSQIAWQAALTFCTWTSRVLWALECMASRTH